MHSGWRYCPAPLNVILLTIVSLVSLMLQDVEAARQEANDNVTFLKPLRRYFEKLSVMDDFVALSELFKPLLHTMLLIWKYSRSYNSSARFATLIREICNDLIMQACKFVPGRELLQMDPNEACDKLRTTLKVLGSFKAHYFAYKTASATECPTNLWRFQNSIIFGRLDTFLERCNDMLELQSTCLQVCSGAEGRLSCCGARSKAQDGQVTYDRDSSLHAALDVCTSKASLGTSHAARSVLHIKRRKCCTSCPDFGSWLCLTAYKSFLNSCLSFLNAEW
eukprot:GHRR01027187.1.p1 GENE.GHRR01027187.1~~GHRR01027187.1.p1  ORF type:complete len:279 (-),score=71.24 GHRR01027187.1:540-1376(-)